MDGWVYRWIYGFVDRWKDDGLILERRTDGWIDGQMTGWTMERLKGLLEGRRTAYVGNNIYIYIYMTDCETNCLKLESDCYEKGVEKWHKGMVGICLTALGSQVRS